MCTAISFTAKDHYFGRNLDWEHSFGEEICIVPRKFPFEFSDSHYAIIGTALIKNGYPLFFDATNEMGLSVAGLSFPQNAYYKNFAEGFDNVPSYDFIPWILSHCDSVEKAEIMLSRINITSDSFASFDPSPLHWMISDKERSIVTEPCRDGVKVYENPVGVLTNNPPFETQLTLLCRYMNLSSDEPKNTFSSEFAMTPFSKGMGAIGLPGDLSSPSRFSKCSFVKLNCVPGQNEEENVSQFFHILKSVEQQKGSVKTNVGYEMTIYTSCCNTDKGIYYYNTYYNSRINAVDMNKENLDSDKLFVYPMLLNQDIKRQN